MRRRVMLVLAIAAAVAVAVVVLNGRNAGRQGLVVGGVEDAAKWSDPLANMDRARTAGFRVIVLSSVWASGETAPAATDVAGLQTAVGAARRVGIDPIVAVYFFSRDTPLTPQARADFASYAAALLRALPGLRYISLGNEPNSNEFWMPQFGPGGVDAAARDYFDLLRVAYPAVKAVSSHVTVIGGSLAARGSDDPHSLRQTHSPVLFLRDFGRAFRASGLRKPPLDLFSLHPYPANSSIPPNVANPHSNSLGIADYPRLVRLLTQAFGHPLPIIYGEYGIQTEIPRAELDLYSGHRAASIKPVSERRQAADYVEAIKLASCQPLVKMLVFFHVTDESQFTGLQTGLYYPNERPKASLRRVADWARTAESGRVQCRS